MNSSWFDESLLEHEMLMARRYAYFIGFTIWSLACYLLVTLYSHRDSAPADLSSSEMSTNFPDVNGWEPDRSRSASDYIHPDRVTTLVNSPKTCSGAYPPSVLVVVSSSTDHFASRTAIRKTWADSIDTKFNMSVAFFVGVSGREEVDGRLIDESAEFGDIVIEDFVDTYNNLTLKSLMMLKWVKNNCQKAPYILRMDDDVYINVKNLAAFVEGLARSDGPPDVLCGQLFCSGTAFRDIYCKWYMPPHMYSKEVYPDYLAGYCYLASTEIALRIYDEAFSIPMIYIDDVFLTGMCTERMGIKPTEHYLFKGFKGGKVMEECTAQDEYLIVHSYEISVEYLYAVHGFIAKCSGSPDSKSQTVFPNGTVIRDSDFIHCTTSV